MQTEFLIYGDIAVYDNAPIHVKGDNDMLCNILYSVGIDIILLPTCSSELNPIELVFNVIMQRFTSK